MVLCKTLEEGEPRTLGKTKGYMERKCNPSCEFKDVRAGQKKDRAVLRRSLLRGVWTGCMRGVLHNRTSRGKWHRGLTKKGQKASGLPEKWNQRGGLMYLGNGIQQQGGVSGSESSERQ